MNDDRQILFVKLLFMACLAISMAAMAYIIAFLIQDPWMRLAQIGIVIFLSAFFTVICIDKNH